MTKKKDNNDGDSSDLILYLARWGSFLYLAFIFVFSLCLFFIQKDGLKVNEFGDWLAGAFAPLAFGWLAVAVLLQKSELKAQREELALTREEMEAQREVMKQHAEEARASKEFIGQQTVILQKQQKMAEQAVVDQEINELVEQISKTADAIESLIANDRSAVGNDDSHVSVFNYPYNENMNKFDQIIGFTLYLNNYEEVQVLSENLSNVSRYGIIVAWIVKLQRLSEHASPAAQQRFKVLRSSAFAESLKKVQKYFDELGWNMNNFDAV